MRISIILALLAIVTIGQSKVIDYVNQNYVPISSTLGEFCQIHNDCKGNLLCNSYICECPDRLAWSQSLGRCISCPPGWAFYLNNCYIVSTEKKSWIEASNYCEANQGQLVAANTEVIIDVLIPLVEFFGIKDPTWVGAKTINLPGNWSWNHGFVIPGAGPWWDEKCNEPDDAEKDPVTQIKNGCAYLSKVGGLISDKCDIPRVFICQLKEEKDLEIKQAKIEYSDPTLHGAKCKADKDCGDSLQCHYKYKTCICKIGFQWSEKVLDCIKCPNSFTVFEDKCLFLSEDQVSWSETINKCKALDATLFVIDTKVIIDVTAPLSRIKGLTEPRWIGANDGGDGFKWLNGKSIDKEGLWWATCDRKAQSGGDVKCVKALPFGILNDKCDNKLKYICQYNLAVRAGVERILIEPESEEEYDDKNKNKIKYKVNDNNNYQNQQEIDNEYKQDNQYKKESFDHNYKPSHYEFEGAYHPVDNYKYKNYKNKQQ